MQAEIFNHNSHDHITKETSNRTCGDIARACCFIIVMTSAQTVLTRESQCAEGTFTFCSATTESSNQINKPIHQQSIALTADDSTATDLNVDANDNAALLEGTQVLTCYLHAAATGQGKLIASGNED